MARDELHADRQAARIPAERHRHRRLAGQVEQLRAAGPRERLLRRLREQLLQQRPDRQRGEQLHLRLLERRRLQLADPHRRARERRAQDHVVARDEARDLHGELALPLEHVRQPRAREPPADDGHCPGRRLEFAAPRRAPGQRARAEHHLLGDRRPQRQEGFGGARIVDVQHGRFDVMAERRDERGGVVERRARVGGERRREHRVDDEADPQRVGRRVERAEEGAGRAGRQRLAGRDVEQQRAVAHAARYRVLDHQVAVHRDVDERRMAARLQAEQPAARRGDADRAAPVGRVRERHDAGRDGRRRAAARAARRVVEAPRVAARAEQRRLGVRHLPDLGRVGLAEEVEAGRAAARDQRRIGVGREIPVVPAAHRQRQARHGRAEILDEVGHAGKRRVGRGRRGGALARGVVVLQHDRVDRRIDRFGLRDRRVEQLARAHLALTDEIGEADRVMGEIV